ncbi:MAG: hypothetical protein EOP06_28185 [Proteobacteria bacterium]|nr:MAG: hypothetical protein EOP06_28185 [Pseudomonadota bacterium]
MNKPTEPNTPEGLLERCLSTIPDAATYRPATPRLSPDAGSRARLRWLSVAAAIPIVTAVVALPMRHWLNTRNSISRSDIATSFAITDLMKKQDYIRRTSWDQLASPNKQAQYGWKFISHKFYRVYILDRTKGIFTAETDSSFKKILEGTPNVHSLTLPSGARYMNNKRRQPVEKTQLSWKQQFERAVDRMLLYGTLGDEVTLADKTPKQYVEKWRGQALPVTEYTFKIIPDKRWMNNYEVDLFVRAQYFISPETGLIQGERWYKRKGKETQEVLIEEAEFSYAPQSGDEKYFVPPHE